MLILVAIWALNTKGRIGPPAAATAWTDRVRLGFHLLGGTNVFQGDFEIHTDRIHSVVVINLPLDWGPRRHSSENLAKIHVTRSGVVVSLSKLARPVPFSSAADVAGAIYLYATAHYGKSVAFATSVRRNPRGYWNSILWTEPMVSDTEHFLIIEPKRAGLVVTEDIDGN